MKHPYTELAELLEDKLKAQREHDRKGTGVVIFPSEQAEDRAREEARRLRYLASIDKEYTNG